MRCKVVIGKVLQKKKKKKKKERKAAPRAYSVVLNSRFPTPDFWFKFLFLFPNKHRWLRYSGPQFFRVQALNIETVLTKNWIFFSQNVLFA